MSHVTAVTDATFAAEVLHSPQPVLVDYWADWCAPCRQLAPVIEELARTYAGRAKFVSVDTNQNTAVTAQRDIRTLPTVQILVDGQVVDAMVGSVTKMKLRQALDNVLGD
jgi:thioredoxin 1